MDEIALLEAELFHSDWVIVPAPLNIPGGWYILDVLTEDQTHLLIKTFFGGIWYYAKSPIMQSIL